jgi:SAM-dependent methyltransferase
MGEQPARRLLPRGVLQLARQGRLVTRMEDGRRQAPAAGRNRDPILQVLRDRIGAPGLVLEVASGTGEHIVHFARHFPAHAFQPTDPDAPSRASIDAWVAAEALSNVRPALALDATADIWPVTRADVVICINMIHIAPWPAAEGLIAGAARVLAGSRREGGGTLFLYGPYRRPGRDLEPGNAAFDATLRARDASWGIRDLDAVARLAALSGFSTPEVVEMPANNLVLCFRHAALVC